MNLSTYRPLGFPLFYVLLSVFPVLGRYLTPIERILLQQDVDTRSPPLVATVNADATHPIHRTARKVSRLTSLLEDLAMKDEVTSSSSPSSMSSYTWSSAGSFGENLDVFGDVVPSRGYATASGSGGIAENIPLGDRTAAVTRARARVFGPGLRGNEVLLAPYTPKYVSYTNSSYGICGVRPEPVRGVQRIVVGSNAPQRWPWQAMLINTTTNKPFCGATLITNEHVLTAAHCLHGKNRSEVVIRLGEYDRNFTDGHEQDFSIGCLHIHHRYEPTPSFRNDIALIKLATSVNHRVELNDYVTPACLPETNEFVAGATCHVMGWGYTGFVEVILDQRAMVLQEAAVPLVSNQQCKLAYGTRVKAKMVCAGDMAGSRRADTCKGDSGGPLICRSGIDGPFKLWGITSWGKNYFCNPEPKRWVPGVYTRVEKYLRWIQRKLKTRRCW